MSIVSIESALEIAIMFGDDVLAAIYEEALAEAGVEYQPHSTSWRI